MHIAHTKPNVLLARGFGFDTCCKSSFLLVTFSPGDFCAPMSHKGKMNWTKGIQHEQKVLLRFLLPSFNGPVIQKVFPSNDVILRRLLPYNLWRVSVFLIVWNNETSC